MLDMGRLAVMAAEAGFTHSAPLDVSTLELRDEVRAMCSANTCRAYGRNWSCPPACGMMEAEAAHKEHFNALHERLLETWPGLLALGAGTCTRCRECTYPDAPCRFPEKRVSSMEACGLVVMDTCKANGLGYYYGPQSIAYTSCFLLE